MSRVVVDELDVFPFEHFHVLFPNHSFTIVAGSNRSGKTVLAKCLAGRILTKKKVMVQKTYLENINLKESGKGVVAFFEEDISFFLGSSVSEQLKLSIVTSKDDACLTNKKLKEVISIFGLQKYLRTDPNKLDFFMRLKVYVASLLIDNPEVFVLDDPTKRLTSAQRKEFISILNRYQSLGLTIILITSSLEDALFANISRICILHQGSFVLEGNKDDVLCEDSLLSKVGLALPFMVDLSVKLRYYNLVDQMILEQESLVEYLWK